jgi:hypothetical protein
LARHRKKPPFSGRFINATLRQENPIPGSVRVEGVNNFV